MESGLLYQDSIEHIISGYMKIENNDCMQLPRNLFPPIDFAYIPTYYFLRFPTISTILGSPMELNSIIPGR